MGEVRQASADDVAIPPVRGGLQLEEDRPLQERFWRVERFVHFGFALMVVLACLGLTGAGGPLAHATARQGEATITYPRIARWATDLTVLVRFPSTSRHTLAVGGALSSGVVPVEATPDPSAAGAGPDTLRYRFDGDGEARVALRLHPTRPGLVRLAVVLDDAPPLALLILVLP